MSEQQIRDFQINKIRSKQHFTLVVELAYQCCVTPQQMWSSSWWMSQDPEWENVLLIEHLNDKLSKCGTVVSTVRLGMLSILNQTNEHWLLATFFISTLFKVQAADSLKHLQQYSKIEETLKRNVLSTVLASFIRQWCFARAAWRSKNVHSIEYLWETVNPDDCAFVRSRC